MPRRLAEQPVPETAPPPLPPSKIKGGFRFTALGSAVNNQPREASAILAGHLRKHGGNVSATARALDTTYRTVSRWIRVLTEAGFDPRQPRPQLRVRSS